MCESERDSHIKVESAVLTAACVQTHTSIITVSVTWLCSPLGLELMVKLRTLLTVFTLILKAEARNYGKRRYIFNAACRPIPMHCASWLIRADYACRKKLLCSRDGSIRVSVPFGSRTNSKWKWSSLSHWSGDFGVSRACHYVGVWNALGEGSDVISTLSSAGMFSWQRSTVSISRFAVLMSLMPFYCC